MTLLGKDIRRKYFPLEKETHVCKQISFLVLEFPGLLDDLQQSLLRTEDSAEVPVFLICTDIC